MCREEFLILALASPRVPGRVWMAVKGTDPGLFREAAIPVEKSLLLLQSPDGPENGAASMLPELFGDLRGDPLCAVSSAISEDYTAVLILPGRSDPARQRQGRDLLDLIGRYLGLYLDQDKIGNEKIFLSQTLENLSRVNRTILETGSFEAALEQVLSGVNRIVGAEGAGLLLYEEETRSLALQKPAFGSYDDQLIGLYKVKMEDGGNAVQVFMSGEPYLSNNAPEDPRIIQRLARPFGVRNIVSMPVTVCGRCTGVFHVINKPGGFSGEDLGVIRLFVSQLAIAIENARMFDREKKMALRLGRFIDLNERLVQLVLEGAGVQAITESIARDMEAGVVFCDHRLAKRAWAPVDSREIRDFDPSLVDLEKILPQLSQGAGIHSGPAGESPPGKIVVARIEVGGDTLGYLFAFRKTPGPDLDFLSGIRRTLPVYALELLKEKVAREVRQNLEGKFVSALLEGRYSEEQVARQASGIGYNPSRPYVVVVAEFGPEAPRAEQDLLVSCWQPCIFEINCCLKHHYPQSLAVTMQDRLIVLLPFDSPRQAGETAVLQKFAENLRKELARISKADIYIGIGRVAQAARELESSYKDASFSIRYIKQTGEPGRVAVFRDLGLYQALADEQAAGHLFSLMRELLGPLLESDRKRGTAYLKTLDHYFAGGCSIKTAAESLFCHVNTVRYRLDRIAGLSRVDLEDFDRRFDLQMSLKLAKFYYPEYFKVS